MPRKKGESRREYYARLTGKSKEDYKKSAYGQAIESSKDYYKKKKGFIDERADMDIKRLKEDFKNVLRDAGISRTRLQEDYERNMERMIENKEVDTEDLKYYVQTQTGRTAEDKSQALERETFRYELEKDRHALSLAKRNLAFSGLKGVRGREEGELKQVSDFTTEEIETKARRSFQDIQRYEFAKNRSIEMTFERGEQDLSRGRERGLQDIDTQTSYAKQARKRGVQDVKYSEDVSKFDLAGSRADTLGGIDLSFTQYRQGQDILKDYYNTLG